jgi:hypothetical protein
MEHGMRKFLAHSGSSSSDFRVVLWTSSRKKMKAPLAAQDFSKNEAGADFEKIYLLPEGVLQRRSFLGLHDSGQNHNIGKDHQMLADHASQN